MREFLFAKMLMDLDIRDMARHIEALRNKSEEKADRLVKNILLLVAMKSNY